MVTLASQDRTRRNVELGPDSWDPPQRISTLPLLDTHEAQDRFLCSPSAVLESLGLRIPAALARHIRRSDPPPPAQPPLAQQAVAAEREPVPTHEHAPAAQKPKRARKKK
jgi:hypothetical protein